MENEIINANEQHIQINILMFMLKKCKIQVNMAQISDILEVGFREVKDRLIYSESFPKPIIMHELPMLKSWLLYDILDWAIKKEKK